MVSKCAWSECKLLILLVVDKIGPPNPASLSFVCIQPPTEFFENFEMEEVNKNYLTIPTEFFENFEMEEVNKITLLTPTEGNNV